MIRLAQQIQRSGIMLAFLLAFGVARVDAAPQSSNQQSLEDLGDGLLDDSVLKELIDAAGKAKAGEGAPSDDQSGLLPDIDSLRRMLEPETQSPPAGEDLGQAGESPLSRISDRMLHARELLASQSSSGETRAVQEEIVSELDKLIEQLNKQCQKCGGGQCNKPGEQQTQRSTPKPGRGEPAASAGTQSKPQPSRVTSGGGGEAQPGDLADRDVVKQLWGQLPDRLRQQLLQSTADEFLPKYREELEMYFRRLAEEQSDGASDK